MRITAFIAMLICSNAGWAQPYPLLKKGDELAPAVPPRIYRATALEGKSEVVIQLRSRNARITDKKDADNVTVMAYVWEDMKPLTLDKEIKAYSQAGKPLDKEAVLKALAKQTAVVCFVRVGPDDPERPDPIYAAMFRDDTVFLVFQGKDLLR